MPDADQRARGAAAAAAADRVQDGMTLGLGSGRAVWRTIEILGERFGGGGSGRAPLRSAFASEVTRERAVAVGIEPVELDGSVRLDLAIDGADEVDPQLGLIKGGGAALLREKLVVEAAERFLVVAETGKQVERLGQTRTLPVEVVRFAWRDTRRRVRSLVPGAELRVSEVGDPVVTDEGHYLLDCELPREGDLAALGDALKSLVGVVEHGLFLGMADAALLGTAQGETVELTAG